MHKRKLNAINKELKPTPHLIKNSYVKLNTAQKMKFSIKDFSSKCDQVRRKLRIWSHLLEKSLIENLILVQWKYMISNY